MSKTTHPNINAAGMAADVTQAFNKYLRGDAAKNLEVAFEVFSPMVVEFLSELSTKLDQKFGN